MKDRSRWYSYLARVEVMAPLDDAAFHALAAEIRAEPDASVRRAMVVHLARIDREVASDGQLRELASMFTTGRDRKVPVYVERAITTRRARRG